MDSAGLGIYVSIPFCSAKCSYCNFASGVFAADRIGPYLARLHSEVRSSRDRAALMNCELGPVTTLFFGGGTPSLLTAQQFSELAAVLREQFAVAPDVEWTIECAPGQLEPSTLDAMVAAGVNRISLGVQSFVDRESAAVGRRHTQATVAATLAQLRSAGITNINVDLIAGLPHQNFESWNYSLLAVAESGVPHASVYMLEVDDDSRLGRELLVHGNRYGAASVPGDEQIAEFYATACEFLRAAGITQYEISNFARAGYESCHNLRYWLRRPYVGFGLDAHSCLFDGDGSALRFSNSADMPEYLAAAHSESRRVSRDEALEEEWFLGLRLNHGVSIARLISRYGPAASAHLATIDDLVAGGLLTLSNGTARLTPRGRLISNDVFEKFLAPTGAAA
jgi:oxygen-independent coproporphyrinogen-3 oxidase